MRSAFWTVIFSLILILMTACSSDDPTPDVAGSSARSQSAQSVSSGNEDETPPTPNTLPPSLINISNADQITGQATFGQGELLSFTWSTDPQTLVVIASDGIRLYDTQNLDTPPSIFPDYMGFAVFSPDASLAISQKYDGSIVLWDTFSGNEYAILETTNPLPASFHFSPDGEHIVGIDDDSIKIWDGIDGAVEETIALDAAAYHNGFYRDDGTLLALINREETLALVDVRADETIFSEPTTFTFFFLLHSISANGRVISVPIYNPELGFTEIKLWDTQTGDPLNPLNDTLVNFSPDGSAMTYLDREQNIVVLDTLTQDDIAQIAFSSLGSNTFNTTPQLSNVLFNADGSLIAAQNFMGRLKLFSLETESALTEITDVRPPAITADLSQDGQTVLIAYPDGFIQFWDVPSGEIYDNVYVDGLGDAMFAPDSIFFLTAGDDITRWNSDSLDVAEIMMSLEGMRLAFNPDQTLLAIGYDAYVRYPESHDGFVRLWDIEESDLHIADIDLPDNNSPDTLIFSPDGEQLAVSLNSPLVVVYAVDSGQEIRRFETIDPVRDIAMSPDGSQLVAVTATEMPEFVDPFAEPITPVGHLWLWDVDSGDGGSVEGIQTSSLTSVAFSPDGSLLVLGGTFEDGGMALLNANTLEIIAYLGQPNQAARHIQFTPNGDSILSVGADNLVRIWGLNAE